MSNLDCPTTDPAIFANCKCGHTSKGTKYCDVEGGDDEWTEAYSFVSDFLSFYNLYLFVLAFYLGRYLSEYWFYF